jgi:acid phosphatase (class A)
LLKTGALSIQLVSGLLLLGGLTAFAADPAFLPKDSLAAIKAVVPAPPLPGSDAQKRDEQILKRLQASRTPQQCARAESEAKINAEGFFLNGGTAGQGAAKGPLLPKEAEKLTPFLDKVQKDTIYFVKKLKKDYSRKRPFLYIDGLTPCVTKEMSNSFPSGHTMVSRVVALVLGDIFPTRKDAFMSRADEVAEDRVLGGVHHPSDIEAGKKAGDEIYALLQKSAEYGKELAAAKQWASTAGK